MYGYGTKAIHVREFCRRVQSILLVLIECSKNNVLDNSDFGRIFDGIAFVQMANNFQIYYIVCAKSLTVTKHV